MRYIKISRRFAILILIIRMIILKINLKMKMKIKTKMKMKMKIGVLTQAARGIVLSLSRRRQVSGVDDPCRSYPTVRVVLALVVEHVAHPVVEYLAPEPVPRAA